MGIREVMDQLAAQREQEPVHTKMGCAANGCRLPVSVGTSGNGACSFHYFGESARWQQITRALREHQWLFDAIAEIGMAKDWRTTACRIMRQRDADMFPSNDEDRELYFYRLHQYGHWVAGNRARKPSSPIETHGAALRRQRATA